MSGALSVINQGLGAVNLLSNLGGVVGTFLGTPIPGFGPILIKRYRMIDTIIPNVAIREQHRDRLTITSHPVEIGAAISDHAFKEPVDLVMECGFSNSQGFYETYSQDVYKRFLALQAERRPFSVITGKRQYNNMLIAELSVTTDVHSEFNLMIQVTLREVILVKLATVRSSANQSEPSKTAPPVKDGDKQPTLASQVPTPQPPPPVSDADFAAHPGTGLGTAPGSGTTPHVTIENVTPPTSVGAVDDFGRPIPPAPFNPTENIQTPTPPQPMAAPPTPPVPPTPPAVSAGPSPPVPAIGGPSFDAPIFSGQ